MKDSLCVVLCNLKPKKLADYISHGMVLCAEPEDRTSAELLQPPPGSQPGDLISIGSFERKPPAELNAKKNPWDTVQPKLRINQDGVACYDDVPLSSDKGVVRSKTLTHGGIH